MSLLVIAAALLAGGGAGDGMEAVAPGALEGRPAAGQVSPLQARLDAAPTGATIVVLPGTYHGDLVIERPLRLVGRPGARLVGSGAGSVVRVRAANATIEGFEIDGRGGGDLGRDAAGVHVAATGVTVRDLAIHDTLFGVYLREAHGATVERCTIDGIAGKEPGEKGSGIHVWNTDGFRLAGNVIRGTRDGFYIQSSPHGRVTGNEARDLRYGLHYMFSDDNVFEDNVFESSAAGTAIMYSRRLEFRRNRFLHNRGFASVGLLFKECDDVLAESNVLGDNARGVFLDGARRALFRHNVIAGSDIAVVLYDSCAETRFESNVFVGNMSPLNLVGRRTDTVFRGNYWSEHDVPDIDGDGIADAPFRLSSVLDHLRGNLLAADLMTQGPAAHVVALAERCFPVLDAIPVLDAEPLARPPAAVAALAPRERARSAPAGLGISAGLLALGALAWLRWRR